MATFYLDYEGGSDAADGTSYANRWKTITSGATAARIAPGDTIRVMASPDPTSLGISATWTNKSPTVTLASALNVLINDGEAAWTASTNVTCTKDTSIYRTGTGSAKQAIAAGFTTGKAAYFGLGATNDYSAYQGITFWIRLNQSTLAASTLSLRLCSDTTGDTTVDTLAIPAISQTGQWVPMYIDKGSALGSSIQSIALYADADPGTIDVYLDNISTVKAAGADALNLTALISKNTAGETWWCLREINGTTLRLDGGSPANSPIYFSSIRGYWGTTESVTTYMRGTIPTALVAGLQTQVHTVQDAGTSGNLIRFSGGWNRTDMSTQTGETWFDGQSGWGNGLQMSGSGTNYTEYEKIRMVRYYIGYIIGATGLSFLGDTVSHNCQGAGIYTSMVDTTMGDIYAYGSPNGLELTANAQNNVVGNAYLHSNTGGGSGFGMRNSIGASLHRWTFTSINACNNQFDGCLFSLSSAAEAWDIGSITMNDNGRYGPRFGVARRWRVGPVEAKNNGTAGMVPENMDEVWINGLTTSGNTFYGMDLGNAIGRNTILNAVMSEATPINHLTNDYRQGWLALHNWQGTVGSHKAHAWGGLIESETGADRHTASGIGWKISPKTTVYVTSTHPLALTLMSIPVKANKLVTVRAYMKRSNTGLTGKLVCKGRQIPGVASDVVDTVTAAADTWEELEITFTPTEAGGVTIEAHAYGGTTYSLFVDDMTVFQAS